MSYDIGYMEKVLDHGYVKFIDRLGDDLTPLEAARMSTGNATGVDEDKDTKLRNRLWGLNHTSPFEMNMLCVELQVPLFVLRQIDRHRTTTVTNLEADIIVSDYDEFRKYTSRNEFSARYAEMPDLFYVPDIERIQRSGKSKTNKQGSGGSIDGNPEHVRDRLLAAYTNARMDYLWLIEQGVATELARAVLPAAQYTKIRLQSSMLNWFKFFALRLPEEAQWETRQYSKVMGRIARATWPRSWEVFEKFTLYAKTFNNEERLMLLTALEGSFASRDAFAERLAIANHISPEQAKALARKVWPEDGEEIDLLT